MLISSASQTIRKKLGFVADFCPYCRDFRQIRVERVGTRALLAGQSSLSSHSSLIRFDLICLTCRGVVPRGEIDELTPQKRREKGADLERLLAATNPTTREACAPRLEMERILRKDPRALDPEDRIGLIIEPFDNCFIPAAEIAENSYLDLPLILSLPIGIGITALMGYIVAKLGGGDTMWVMLPIGTGALALGGILYVGSRSGQRRVRRVFLKLLRNALEPLQPTQAELASFWHRLKGHPLGKAFKIRDFADSP